ncbi:VPLPA-CTERM sorting domain-containing protein [Methylomonas rhizoryzae]|uniref:VPLPA-CTERM sorting domain-containing protein n=1 Tax=Methylomonas rhizoryzae TaxID=2608981 RepID=UPI001232AAC3|nr:VPLPA-CTERM sorting domain-containing protein [Methylomonas rhizoryzae]
MTLTSLKLPLAASLLMLFGTSQSAYASSSAYAYIDWGSLNIEYFDLSDGENAPTLSWYGGSGQASSNAYTAYLNHSNSDSMSANDLTSELYTDADTASAQSSSVRDEYELSAYADSQTSDDMPFDWWTMYSNNAGSSASNYVNFELTGHGIALITLDWELGGESDSIYYSGNDYANASVNISGQFSDGNNNTGTANTSLNEYTWDGAFYQEGTFVMAIFSDGIHTVTGSLSAALSAYATSPATGSEIAPVPVPAAAWLFASALGVWGAGRRRAQIC